MQQEGGPSHAERIQLAVDVSALTHTSIKNLARTSGSTIGKLLDDIVQQYSDKSAGDVRRPAKMLRVSTSSLIFVCSPAPPASLYNTEKRLDALSCTTRP